MKHEHFGAFTCERDDDRLKLPQVSSLSGKMTYASLCKYFRSYKAFDEASLIKFFGHLKRVHGKVLKINFEFEEWAGIKLNRVVN
jgi:hypothetical protein